MKPWLGTLVAVSAVLVCTTDACAQQSLAEAARRHAQVTAQSVEEDWSAPPTSLEDALHGMFAAADVVFAGTVTHIEKTESAVVVRFRVDDGIRGVATGAMYTLREWSGLWADDPTRYVEGERRLLLLHAPSAGGYASPVAGAQGAIRLRGNAAQVVADLRWIATSVRRTEPSLSVRALAASSVAPVATAEQDHSAVDGTMVSGMLHAWQRSEAAQ